MQVRRKAVVRCIAIYAAALAVLTAALYISAFLPQDRIIENAKSSAELLVEEGAYPKSGDHAPSTTLDNWTDALMLNLSAAMNQDDLQSVWTNSYYGKADSKITADDLYAYSNGDEDMNKGEYPRYWMGFRASLRMALTFLNYAQIRRVINLVFFSLVFLTAASVAKRINTKTAAAFFLSVLFVRPQVISGSLQFTTCFFIALPAMLLVPIIESRKHWEAPFFMLLGMLTMYFDFYTYPLITLGYPLVYLYLLRRSREEAMGLRSVLADCGIWLGSYLVMWLSKLSLSAVFGHTDAFSNGMGALMGWLSPDKSTDNSVSIPEMLERLRYSIFPDSTWIALAALAVLVFFAYLLLLKRRGAYDFKLLKEYPALLILAILPFIWFCVAAKPTFVHAWFQYRSIAVSYWALFALLSMGFRIPKAD